MVKMDGLFNHRGEGKEEYGRIGLCSVSEGSRVSEGSQSGQYQLSQ